MELRTIDTVYNIIIAQLREPGSCKTYKELAKNPINILQSTIAILMADVSLVETWCNLFSPPSNQCVQEHCNHYPTVENDDELFQSEGEEALEFELEQILVLEIFERVIKYFTRVHLSDISSNFLDEKMAKK